MELFDLVVRLLSGVALYLSAAPLVRSAFRRAARGWVMAGETIEIGGDGTREPELINVKLCGEEYAFAKPKGHGLISTIRQMSEGRKPGEKMDASQEAALYGRIEDWLFTSLTPQEANRIRARLADPRDELDIDHITETFQVLVKRTSSRPSG